MRAIAVFCGFLALGGCDAEQRISISGRVAVHPEVQDDFSPESPGEVRVASEILPGVFRLGVLCSPLEEPLGLDFAWSGDGCAAPSEIRVWAEPLQGDADCGSEQVEVDGPTTAPAFAPNVSKWIFEDEDGDGCRGGAALFDVVLSAPGE